MQQNAQTHPSTILSPRMSCRFSGLRALIGLTKKNGESSRRPMRMTSYAVARPFKLFLDTATPETKKNTRIARFSKRRDSLRHFQVHPNTEWRCERSVRQKRKRNERR